MALPQHLDIRLVYIVAGVLFSTAAQIFMKVATRYEVLRISWLVLIGGSIAAYLGSFVMYYLALRYFPISKVSPVMTIGVVVLVVAFGVLTGEILTARQMAGLLFGVLSLVLLLV
jgi:drug/metabolite transporter (DMT)-like permease